MTSPWLDTLPVPAAPDYAIDWPAIEAACPWLAPLAECMQEPEYHGEGDVLTHTKMVIGELVALAGWRALERPQQTELFLAALLHDVAKPECTVIEDGRIRTPGHASRGARRARQELWKRGVDPAARERIAWLVRLHHVPYHAFERDDPERSAIGASVVVGAGRTLALLSESDARGRISASVPRLVENVGLFAAIAEENDCLDGPYEFANDHSRFMYWRTHGRDPAYAAYEEKRSVVTVMSGLPGAGKDDWLAANAPDLPTVSLDAIRSELKVDPSSDQAPVVAAARERAREHLRTGDDFAWNATNVTEHTRRRAIGLFADYGARVRDRRRRGIPRDARKAQSRPRATRARFGARPPRRTLGVAEPVRGAHGHHRRHRQRLTCLVYVPWGYQDVVSVMFEVERFEWAADDRLEIEGRWFGLRGRRFVRPTLELQVDGEPRRLLALMEHKPWQALDGEEWVAAFAWDGEAGEIAAELAVGADLTFELPTPNGKTTRKKPRAKSNGAAATVAKPKSKPTENARVSRTVERRMAAAEAAREEALSDARALRRAVEQKDRTVRELRDQMATARAEADAARAEAEAARSEAAAVAESAPDEDAAALTQVLERVRHELRAAREEAAAADAAPTPDVVALAKELERVRAELSTAQAQPEPAAAGDGPSRRRTSPSCALNSPPPGWRPPPPSALPRRPATASRPLVATRLRRSPRSGASSRRPSPPSRPRLTTSRRRSASATTQWPRWPTPAVSRVTTRASSSARTPSVTSCATRHAPPARNATRRSASSTPFATSSTRRNASAIPRSSRVTPCAPNGLRSPVWRR